MEARVGPGAGLGFPAEIREVPVAAAIWNRSAAIASAATGATGHWMLRTVELGSDGASFGAWNRQHDAASSDGPDPG